MCEAQVIRCAFAGRVKIDDAFAKTRRLAELDVALDDGFEDHVVKMLLDRGAEVKGAALFALIAALNANSPACVDQLVQSADPKAMNGALLFLVPRAPEPWPIVVALAATALAAVGLVGSASRDPQHREAGWLLGAVALGALGVAWVAAVGWAA